MSGGKNGFSLKRKILISLVSLLGPLLVKLLGSTWRVDWQGEEEVGKIRKEGGKILYAFWHNRILPLVYVYRNRGAKIMISEHGDGELIAVVAKKMGYQPVRGSSTRGGLKAAKQFAHDNSGYDLAITPDGPRGPRQVAQEGAVYIASRGKCALIPTVAQASSYWELNSWDRFIIPKPFCRLKVRAGKPIIIKEDLKGVEIAEESRRLGNTMNEMTRNLALEFGK